MEFTISARRRSDAKEEKFQKGVTFLAPRLIAQISFQEWTDDERLRQPVFLSTSPRGHFAAMLSSAMDELDLSIKELSKQLSISGEHARRLLAGEAVPNRLSVEKTAVATGVPVEDLQLAVERDRMSKKFGRQTMAEASETS